MQTDEVPSQDEGQPEGPASQTQVAHAQSIVKVKGSDGVSTLSASPEASTRQLQTCQRDINKMHQLLTASVLSNSYQKASEQQSSSRRSSRQDSINGLPSRNQSREHLDHLLPKDDIELETYGIQELRDGFFDAVFNQPLPRDRQEMYRKASETLPLALQTHHPLSLRYFIPRQWSELRNSVREIANTRSGIDLFKSFLGFFIVYVVCLIPASRRWLGRYSYILPLSALLNHAGRQIGSQIDGSVLTIIGTIAGLAWGSLALYVLTSTLTAQRGYGGILAAFLVAFTATVAWLRCTFMRLYQAVISAGIAICYICLADTSEAVGWRKLFDYGIPWVLGQAVCIVVSVAAFPDTGSRSLTVSFHEAFSTISECLVFPRSNDLPLRRDLSWHFVKLSTAVRDFTIEISISRFDPNDVRPMRNLTQSVIRSLLSVKPDTQLFDIRFVGGEQENHNDPRSTTQTEHSSWQGSTQLVLELIARHLANPTRDLIDAMVKVIASCDAVVADIGGQHFFLRPLHDSPDHLHFLQALSSAIRSFDAADAGLIADPMLPPRASTIPEVVSLFLFVHPLRQAADSIKALAEKIYQIQQRRRGWNFRFPSYPLRKQFNRTNAQVRHDRGGLTAGFYFRTKAQLDRTLADLQSRPFIPTSQKPPDGASTRDSTADSADQRKSTACGPTFARPETEAFRYKVWVILHRMQGFESRFALKVVLVTTLLSIPAWLEQSRDWWNTYESWWTVVTVWLMTHPRVSGTFQDLAARLICVILGAVWGGLAYRAGNGNPYVMATFAAIFMIPMMHRYTQSAHPRSGLSGCITFTVVSLTALTNEGRPSTVTIAWTRGLAFGVAILASILTNWIMWPFVARHELRKSLSAMMLHLAILYRGVVSKYIYYDEGHEPSAQDIERSEMLEGRLREGFVRIRQLLELTRHEIRLRAPFDPLPYSALIEASERFFEHLVEVRQSSLYFQPSLRAATSQANSSLISHRRDAVAVILMNLYILASALRARQPVPRYMPSAAAARRKLIERMDEVEGRQQHTTANPNLDSDLDSDSGGGKEGRRWADVYRFAFSEALTDIVEQLEQLQRFTKEIVGEAGSAAIVDDD